MNEGILQSIRPNYCFSIAFGYSMPGAVPVNKKEYEVRKVKPKIATPFKTYVYCCKADRDVGIVAGVPSWCGKVPMEYVCNEIIEINADDFEYGHYDISDDDLDKTHLTQRDLWRYGKRQTLYLYHISNLVIYNKPKELSEFKTIDRQALKSCPYRERYFTNPDWTNGASLHAGYSCHIDFVDVNFCRPYENEACECLKSLSRPPQSWCYVKEM